ncbi:MAG: DprA-like winged helix domain-containing protein, partial [Anaerolineae bacterium]
QFALEQGRDTFAVPGSVFSKASSGTNGAIMRSQAKLVGATEDILSELNLNMIIQQEAAREAIPDTPTEKLIFDILGQDPVHIDDIVRETSLPTATVSSTLCMMELKGTVKRCDNARYIVGSRS